ncbi:hypothetical protein HYE54_00530, partial [Aggregatibacter actinomycetemcomitans]|uniref:toxin VasX n=1 Tax=Aggregatibacter actinomycetemcomitans TaxID=714 RepID=UPI00197B0A5C
MKPVDSIIAPCQNGVAILPARLALTDAAFDAIKEQGTSLIFPEDMPEAGQNYELRLLREGYIYILAINAQVDGLYKITAEVEKGFAWYVYHFQGDNQENFIPYRHPEMLAYQFRQIENLTDKTHRYISLPQPFILLNEAIKSAYMMYSDIFLPESLLRKIEQDTFTRNAWMRQVQFESPGKYSRDIQQAQTLIQDFSMAQFKSDTGIESNCFRFTPIGKPQNTEALLDKIANAQGVIVALEDPVGTARDLSGYHFYLTAQRDKILAKYEYAISTARILDSHALHKYKQAEKASWDRISLGNEELRSLSLPTKEPAPINFSKLYREVFADCLKPEHLTANGDADVLNVLKAELQLEDELPGVNAINKMAYIPTRFGTQFKHLVNVHCAFIEKHRDKLSTLQRLYQDNGNDGGAANAWCCYMHGFVHGLDISPYGRNALIAALPLPDAPSYKAPPYAQQAPAAVESLKRYLSDLTKALGGLEKVAKAGYLNIASYDLVIDILIDKIYVRYASSSHKGYIGKPFSVPQTIRQTYQANLNSKEIEKILPSHRSQAALPKQVRNLQNHIRSLKTNLAPTQYGLFQLTEGLAGLNKALSASVILGFFVQNKAETELGQLGNDPFLASLQVIAGMYAPKGGLERHTSQALSELEQLTARKSLQQNKWISYFEQKGAGNMLTRIRNAIINVNTALAGVGAMFEFFNWVEADYKSDEVGKTAALLSMGGGLAIEGAIGALGVLAGSSTLSAGTLTLLTGLSYATLGIGIVLVTIGIIYNQFSPEDIE